MHIKICSRCHFAVVMKRRICQVCGNNSFSEIAVAEEPAKAHSTKSTGSVGHALKGLAETLWVDMQETAQKSKRASQHLAKIMLRGKGDEIQDASQQHQQQ